MIRAEIQHLAREMRQNFERTWQKIEWITTQLGDMERQNVHRFLAIMHALDAVQTRTGEEFVKVTRSIHSLRNNVDFAYQNLVSYMDRVVDKDAKLVIRTIRKERPDEVISHLRCHTDQCDWQCLQITP